MAEGTYEFECMRAELLGISKPDKEQFELARAERLKAEQEQLDAEQTTNLEEHDESLQRTGGKLDELNSILSSTQQKLQKFKKTACGSLSNIFHRPSVDEGSSGNAANTSNAEFENSPKPAGIKQNMEESLDTLNTIRDDEQSAKIEGVKHASLDIQKKMTSHLDKLDALISKADNAEYAMSAQTKEMKRFIK